MPPRSSKSDHELLIELNTKINHIEKELDDLVTRTEFHPVKLVVYGLVGMVLSSVLAAVVATVVNIGIR